jgi:hypothetical protein
MVTTLDIRSLEWKVLCITDVEVFLCKWHVMGSAPYVSGSTWKVLSML